MQASPVSTEVLSTAAVHVHRREQNVLDSSATLSRLLYMPLTSHGNVILTLFARVKKKESFSKRDKKRFNAAVKMA